MAHMQRPPLQPHLCYLALGHYTSATDRPASFLKHTKLCPRAFAHASSASHHGLPPIIHPASSFSAWRTGTVLREALSLSHSQSVKYPL